MKKIYGVYQNAFTARNIIDQLLQEGYTREDIKIIANKDISTGLYEEEEVEVEERDHRSLWERIKDAFTFEEYNDDYWDQDLNRDERELLLNYKDKLQSGDIVILVDPEVMPINDDPKSKMYRKSLEYEEQVSKGNLQDTDDVERDLRDEEDVERQNVDTENYDRGNLGRGNIGRDDLENEDLKDADDIYKGK